LTTHQLDLVDQLADRVGIIQNGEIIKEGSITQLKENTLNYLYQIAVRGQFKIPADWIKNYEVSDLKTMDGTTEFDLNCHSQSGLTAVLDFFSRKKVDLIYLQKKRNNLEEVFLKSLKTNSDVTGKNI